MRWKVKFIDNRARITRHPFYKLDIEVDANSKEEAIKRAEEENMYNPNYVEYKASLIKEGRMNKLETVLAEVAGANIEASHKVRVMIWNALVNGISIKVIKDVVKEVLADMKGELELSGSRLKEYEQELITDMYQRVQNLKRS
jgi:hypothetical protein